ncbi:MAG: hypothetical protein IT183_06500 [Acidobacteria bacterium]|nr:hypothetical protein [Acidobacteriota bacterium]
MSRSLRELCVALPIAALLAVALTWPLTPRMASSGRVDSGDARHGIWNVAWVARALTSDPGTLYDANIFHPHGNALAFSEANIVAGVMAIPVWLVTRDGLAAANSAILLSFVFSALSMFALARYLTGSVAASALAALMFAYSPYAFARLAHMQLLMTFGLPLTMLALHGFVDRPGARRALLLGAVMAVTALLCGYYGIFVGLAVGWGLIWFAAARAHWRSGRYWLLSAGALITAAVLTGPFMLPYATIRDEGFARSLADARLFSADWQAYLASAKLVHDWMLPLLGDWNDVLFPGFLALIFAMTAIVQSARGSAGAAPRAIAGFYASLIVLAAWASFGPDAGLYAAFFKTLPFFELIRAPARFGVLVTLGVTTLAALSLATLLRRLDGSRRRLTLVALSAATLATSTVGPLTLAERRPLHPVYERLAHMPSAPVVEFPYFVAPQERHRHTEYMFESLHHWQPLINGYSDHTPPEAVADGLVLASFPSDAAWDVLRRRGARYVVVHWESYPPDSEIRRALFASDVGVRLRLVVDAGDMSLFEVMADAGPGR